MCISETCIRLVPCKLCHIEGIQQHVFLTHCIWSSPAVITEKQTNKQTKCSLLYVWSLCTHFLCFRTLHLTCGFDMMKFAQCQSENAHFSEWHTLQSETCFRMAHISERHATRTYLVQISLQNAIRTLKNHNSEKNQMFYRFQNGGQITDFYFASSLLAFLFVTNPTFSHKKK